MTNSYSRPDDGLPEPDLAALARQYETTVPKRAIIRLEHTHDLRPGLILELGRPVPEYYGRRPGAVVIAILGDDPYCVVSRRQGALQDEEPIRVGKHATQRVDFLD